MPKTGLRRSVGNPATAACYPGAVPEESPPEHGRGNPHVNDLYDIHGYRFRLVGDAPEPLRGLAADFKFFRAESAAEPSHVATISVTTARPDYDCLPPLRARVYTPRNTSYRDGDSTIVDYHGRGLARHDRRSGDFSIISPIGWCPARPLD